MSKILIDEALRLADALEDTDGAHDHEDAAAELRRLHAENQALRQALKQPAPPECKTEAEKTAFAFGWFKALESVREQPAQQEPVAFLANGTRFKISYDSRQSGGQIHGIPPELGGRWVAFVAADDDCHLKLTNPQAQPAQEPVIQDWMKPDALCDRSCLYACTEGFTKFPTCVPPTAPTQEPDPDELTIAYMSGVYEGKKRKPWVGLTEQEHTDIAIECGCMSADWVFYGATVERILKEKNS